MSKDELIDKIDNGNDILFDVSGRHFTILTWMDEGIAIGEQQTDGDLQFFDTAEDLVEQFVVGGKTLAELAKQVVITQYT